jgi:myosin V
LSLHILCIFLFFSSFHQATDTRDALAKSVYASLFEWLVEQINKSLSVGKRRTGRSISILDIYGFESFEEYVDDDIDWAKVEFEDNQDCLNLFEKVCASTFFSLLAICNN